MKKLAPRAEYIFGRFIGSLKKEGSRLQLDWKLFYWFIHAAHQGRLKLTEGQLKERLLSKGLDRTKASELARIYAHGRALLKARPALNYIKLEASNFDMDKGWDEINSK